MSPIVVPQVPPSPSIGSGYSYLTLTQALAQLSERLDDSNQVYWSAAELTSYLQTAMREWQSLTRYWRARMTFNLQSGQQRNTEWYDLTQQKQLLLSYNVLDSQIVAEMLYHLLEPQLSGAGLYVGTDMFSLDIITQSLQRRRDQFLLETGMLLNVTAAPWTPSSAGIQSLADTVMDVRRAAWIATTTGLRSTLWKTDEWSAQAFEPTWANAPVDPPTGYSMATLGPLILQLIPPALNPGTVELLTVPSGLALNPSVGILLGVPDNFVWAVMFGAMADLLGMAGEAADTDRAAYCDARYQEGVIAAKLFSSVETAYVNGQQVFVGSVFDLDSMSASWQNVSGSPSYFGLAGYNLLAVSPTPDNNGPYSALLDVVQNAPVPTLGADKVQLGREELDAVLGEAQHLAAFKQGGDEFAASMTLHQDFMRLALLRNQRLAAAVPSKQPLYDRSSREEKQRTRVEEELPTGVGTSQEG